MYSGPDASFMYLEIIVGWAEGDSLKIIHNQKLFFVFFTKTLSEGKKSVPGLDFKLATESFK